MAQPFLGEIKLFALNFAPRGWHFCDGSLQSISANAALFSLLGTQYGGNGTSTFGLPDLRGRVPIHFGATHAQGALDGVENVALLLSQLPAHTHSFSGTSQAGSKVVPSGTLAQVNPTTSLHYAPDTTTQSLNPTSIMPTGGSQPHNNLQPYLVLNYCIAMSGVFPTRN